MRQKYYAQDEEPPVISLNPENVPVELRFLIPHAEKWGISDDMLRARFIAKAPREEITELQKLVASCDDLLDQWLAGPKAQHPPFSQEYLAFTNMRMAADGC